MREVNDARIHIRLDKEPGTNEVEVEMQAGSPSEIVFGLACLVERVAESSGNTVEHVLSVLAVVLLAEDAGPLLEEATEPS